MAVFPITALLASNIDKTPISDAIMPAVVSMLGVLLIWGILYLITRRYHVSALSASWFIVLFFSYGYFFTLINEAVRHRYLLGLWGLLFVVGVLYMYRVRKFDTTMTYIGNIMAAVLITVSVGQIAIYKIKTFTTELPSPDHIATFDYGTITPPAVLPDVYNIIIDAYASKWSFDEFYKFDISEFTSYLADRGFYIVPKSTSNYPKTAYSLSSQLNMEYLHVLFETEESIFVAGEQGNEERLGRLIENNRLLHFFKSQGYRAVHIGAPVTITKMNRYADENINYQPAPFGSEFSIILYDTTMLKPISELTELIDNRKVHWKRIQFELDELESIASRPEPTYAFAHLEIPHHPYVFDSDGSFVSARVMEERDEKESYIRQVQYLNTVLPKVIDRILEQSDTPPIIVLQSDHGSASAPLHDYAVLTATKTERDFILREGMRNFIAIFLPGEKTAILPDDLTPVNEWRVILNEYFGTSLELLPNKNFFKVYDKQGRNIPGFIDATDVVKYR